MRFDSFFLLLFVVWYYGENKINVFSSAWDHRDLLYSIFAFSPILLNWFCWKVYCLKRFCCLWKSIILSRSSVSLFHTFLQWGRHAYVDRKATGLSHKQFMGLFPYLELGDIFVKKMTASVSFQTQSSQGGETPTKIMDQKWAVASSVKGSA